MKKLGFAFALIGAAVGAQAAINLNIDVQYQTASIPGSGSIFVLFTGTVDILLPTFDASGAALEFPGSSSSVFLTGSFDPAFAAYLGAAAPGVDYSGPLFSIEVTSTTPADFYWLNPSSFGMSALSELIVDASDGTVTASDNEFYGVTVVPEPATLAALGIGAAALLRRRRK